MISQYIYKFIADLIYLHTGILYKETEYFRLDVRITNLMDKFSVKGHDDLVSRLRGSLSKTDIDILINIATNNETYFMRDMKPFEAIYKIVLPELAVNNPTGPLALWSAGCSTGQEPYSIVMSLDANLGLNILDRVSIDATDISQNALGKARSATYNGIEVQRGLPITYLMNYFNQKTEDAWEVKEGIRSKIKFSEFNLLTSVFPREKYHLILCRNVLIYQNADNRKLILQKFFDALKPKGYLMMGNGESLIGLNLNFKQKQIDKMTAYQKE